MDLLILDSTFTVAHPVEQKKKNALLESAEVVFRYQACSEICLPPDSIVGGFDGYTGAINRAPTDTDASKNEASLPFWLLLAFLGGMILNVMPCVLPVLCLKVFSVLKSSRAERKTLLSLALATTSGIVLSFWALAALVTILRHGGEMVGWGFQFQHPGFVAFMVLLTFLVALNLFGVFEVWLPGRTSNHLGQILHKKEGTAGAFWYGFLLVALSTPCSAPFLSPAIGFAFNASVPVLFLFFTTVALGFSLPYLAIAAFPRLVRWLPKPGNWMVTFRQFLAFPMLAVTIWLLWVLERQLGGDVLTAMLVLLFVAAFVAWASRVFAPPTQPFFRMPLVWGTGVAFLFALWFGVVLPAAQPAQTPGSAQATVALEEGWNPYSPALLDSLVISGVPVFIDGTADWCMNCKVNKAAVLSRDTILTAFAQYGVAALMADYTQQDTDITALLQKHGRAAVPFYVLYSPRGKEAILFPELLTTDTILNALERL
jgi:thiol:disulfide interchange protein DsbD